MIELPKLPYVFATCPLDSAVVVELLCIDEGVGVLPLDGYLFVAGAVAIFVCPEPEPEPVVLPCFSELRH